MLYFVIVVLHFFFLLNNLSLFLYVFWGLCLAQEGLKILFKIFFKCPFIFLIFTFCSLFYLQFNFLCDMWKKWILTQTIQGRNCYPISQIRRLRLRETMWLVQATQIARSGSKIHKQIWLLFFLNLTSLKLFSLPGL